MQRGPVSQGSLPKLFFSSESVPPPSEFLQHSAMTEIPPFSILCSQNAPQVLDNQHPPPCFVSIADPMGLHPQMSATDVDHNRAVGRKSWKAVGFTGEAVWAPNVEQALVRALEAYGEIYEATPGSKGCGVHFPMRNRFISTYINKATGKVRTAKQVASRIQHMKDTTQDRKLLCLLRHGVPSLSMQNRIPVNPDADLAAPSPISPSQTVMLVPLHHRAGSSTRTHASTLPSIGASARLPNHFPYPHVALRPSLMPVSAISLPIDVQLPVPRQQPTGIEPVPREVHVKLALLEDCMTSTSSNLELRNATAENPVFVPLARKHKPSSLHPKPTSTRTSPIFSNRISIFSEWQLNAETETRVCIGRQMAQSLLERLVMVADHFDRMTGRIKWIYEYSVASPLWEAICSAEDLKDVTVIQRLTLQDSDLFKPAGHSLNDPIIVTYHFQSDNPSVYPPTPSIRRQTTPGSPYSTDTAPRLASSPSSGHFKAGTGGRRIPPGSPYWVPRLSSRAQSPW